MSEGPMDAGELVTILVRDYKMDTDRAGRVIGIADQSGLDNEPVPGGYIEITSRRTRGQQLYTLTPHTGPTSRQES